MSDIIRMSFMDGSVGERKWQEEEEAPSGVGGGADYAQAQHGGGGQRRQQDIHQAREWQ